MTFVITQPCIDVQDQSCVEVCPVDCIHYEDGPDRMLYIEPEVCIDCGACEPACPVSAIFAEADLPEDQEHFLEINTLWFSDAAAARAKVVDIPALEEAVAAAAASSAPAPAPAEAEGRTRARRRPGCRAGRRQRGGSRRSGRGALARRLQVRRRRQHRGQVRALRLLRDPGRHDVPREVRALPGLRPQGRARA